MRKSASALNRVAVLPLLAVVAFAAVLAGCNAGGVGIFYSLEKETKNVPLSTTLPASAVVTSMSSLGGWYFINGETNGQNATSISQAQIAAGAGSTLTWSSVPTPTMAGALTPPRCIALTAWNGKLYAIFEADTSNSGTVTGSYGLFEGSVTSSGFDTTAGWSAVSAFSTLPSSAAAQNLFVAGPAAGDLFVSVMFTSSFTDTTSATSYALYEYDGTAATLVLGQTPGSTGGTTIVTSPSGVVFDGSKYWIAAGNTLYSATSPTGPFAADPNQPSPPNSSYDPGSMQYSGILYSSQLTTLFVATRQGFAYASYQGGAWTQFPSSTATALTPLNGISEFRATNGGTGVLTDAVIFGSDAGYYEVNFSTTTGYSASGFSLVSPNGSNSISTDISYVTIPLYSAAVVGFYVDTSNAADVRVFALTLDGLWRNEPTADGGTDRTWRID